MKVSRSMNTEAVKTIADSLRTALNRKKEQQPFMNELKKEGISLQTANELWQNYNEQYPTYDYKSDKALTENLNKWQNFFKGEKSTAQPTNAGRDLSHMSDEQLRAIAGGR